MLTAAYLRTRLDYDQSTGHFTWRQKAESQHDANRWNAVFAGTRAGHVNNKGYVIIKVDGAAYKGHRLAWLYVYGTWPPSNLDHKNRIRNDNRIANLRPANAMQNSANKNVHSNNKSGVKGVSRHRQTGKWRADVKYQGKNVYLGLFERKQDAAEAYAAAAAKYFGEYATAGRTPQDLS